MLIITELSQGTTIHPIEPCHRRSFPTVENVLGELALPFSTSQY
jgi:hypothetical protein